jgi:hypothetical protein
MKYLADADTVLEAILNRSKTNESVAKLWDTIHVKSSEIYISRIGFDRINSVVSLFVNLEDNSVQLMRLIASAFKVIEVDSDILEEARHIDLAHNDFESSVEIVCAAEYKFDGIVTDRYESFRHSNPQSKISLKYQPRIMDVESLCVDIQRQQFSVSPQSWQLDLRNHKDKDNYVRTLFHEGLQDSQVKSIAIEDDLSFPPEKTVDFYIDFAEKYGGQDWGNYQENCEAIAAEWDNFEQVLSYCFEKAGNLEEDYYARFVKLWSLLNRFCDLYGYHNDRIFWLDKIISLSQERQNWSDYLSALTSKAWTLIMINRLDDAKDCKDTAKDVLDRAKEKFELVGDISLQFRYYHCWSLYHTHTRQLDLAREDLARSRNLFDKIEAKDLSNKLLIRHRISHMSDFAKIDYEEGLMESVDDSEKKLVSNPDIAKKLFAQSEQTMLSCLELAKSIDWKRGIAYLCNKIANINLDLAQITQEPKDKRYLLDRVEQYLEIGKPIADHNKCNQRRTGSYLLSSARLESMRGELELSKISFIDIPSFLGDPLLDLSLSEKKALEAIYIFDGQGNERKAKQAISCFPDLRKKVPKLELLPV